MGLNRLCFVYKNWVRAGRRWHSPYHQIAFEMAIGESQETIHRMLDCGLLARAEAIYQEKPELFTAAALGKLEYLRGNHNIASKHLEASLTSEVAQERQRATKLLTRLSPSAVLAWSNKTARTRLHECVRLSIQDGGSLSSVSQPFGDEHLLNANCAAAIAQKLQCLNAYWHEMGLSPILQDPANTMFDIQALIPLERESHGSMSGSPTVSVIMTVFNGAQYLKPSMLSMLNQVGVCTQIIVIDDASTDETWNVICDLVREFPHKIVAKRLHQNVGTYRAKNIALDMCDTEYVAFQDADDWSHPERLKRAITWLNSNDQHIAATSRYVRLDHNGRFFSPNVWPLRQWSPNTLVLRRAPVLDSIGRFDQVRFGADTDFFERIRAYFGDRRLMFHKEVMLIAMGLPTSLMHNPATGLDERGHSAKRVGYRNKRAERLLRIARSGLRR